MFRSARIVPAVAVVPLALALAACGSSSGGSPRKSSAIEVSVSVSQCGEGWTSGAAGPKNFVLHDVDTRAGEVDLVDARTGAVYAEIEPIAPGTSTTLHADLGAGTYAFRCSMEDESSVTGASVTLTGTFKGDAPPVLALDQADLVPATKAYEAYVSKRLPGLTALARTLQTDVSTDDLTKARHDWLTAQEAYLLLGAAYGAFGDLDGAIDGRADGLPKGVDDPSWTGLHRLEYGLWHGQTSAQLAPVTKQLVADTTSLQKAFGTAQIDPLDIGIRAHEITENAVAFSLTGHDDYGSHSDLALIRTDITATQTVLAIVRTLLAPRYPALPQADALLASTARYLDSFEHGGTFAPLSSLTQQQKMTLDSDVSQLAEELAPVASILEPRRTS